MENAKLFYPSVRNGEERLDISKKILWEAAAKRIAEMKERVDAERDNRNKRRR